MNVNKVFANEDSIVDLSSLGSKNEVNIFISGPDMNIVTPQGVTVIVNGALYSSIKGNKLSVKFNDGSFSGSQLVSSVDLKNIKLDRIDSALVESDDNSYKKNIDAKNKAEAAKEQTKLQQKIEEAKKAEEAADKAKNEANKAISEMVEAQNASKEIENMLSDFLGDIAAKGSMAQVSDNQAIEAQDIKVTKQEDESPISIKPININTGKGRSNSSSKSDHISDEPVLPKNISVSLKLENSSNSGSKNDMLTNVGMPKFIGTTEPNSTIIIKLDKISIGQLVSDSLGNFDFSSPIELDEGNYVFSVDATDVNGATGTTQLAISVDKTTIAPTFELSAEDKAVAVNNLTAKSNPTIIGTAEKEGVVEIYVGGKLVASENVNAQGEWEHQFKKGVLAEGNNAIKLIAVDKADNRATLNGTIELDTIPPEKPTIALDTQSDSGLKNDNLTNIKQPVFVGKSEPGSKVTLFLGSKHLADIAGDENGVWTFSQPTQLTDGKYTLRVIASDLAGNKSEEGALHFEIDTVISKFSASIVDKDDSGVIGDNITNVLNPKLSGMTEPGCEIEATNKNTGETVKTSSDKKGVWNLSFLKDSVEGINNLSFNVIDKAGNTEDYSFSYHVDTVAPAAPIVALDSFVTLPNGKFATREKLPVFVGSAEPGSTVLIMVDGRDNISVKVGANGKLEYSFPDKFLDGNYSVDFLAMDTAGNHSPKKNYSFTIQTETAIPTAELDPADDSSIKGDWITNKQSGLTLTGTAQQFATVKVYVANNLVGTKFADEAGQWTLDIIQSFPDNEYKVKIETEDKLGFSSSASYDLVIDSFIIQPSIKLHDSSDTGIKDDNITKVAEPLFTGKAEANSTLTLYINDVLQGETVAGKDGVWNIITKSSLGDGVHRAVVKAEDAAGNKSDSLVYKFEVITSTITPTIELLNDTGFDTNDNITKVNTPHLTGTAAANATVKIFAGAKLVGNTVADKNGLWDYTFSHARKLDDGEYNVSASVEDVAGNTARSDDFIIKVDTTLSIPAIELSSISDTGVLGDHLTNSTKPVLLIKNTDSDIREIQVWDEFNNTHIGMATRSNKGVWSYSFIDALSEGEHRFYIKAEDIAGNQCNSLPFVLTVDTQLSVPTIALMPGEDSGVNKTDNKTNLTQPKFILDSFDTDVDESKIKVEMTDGNQTHLLAVTKNGGQWAATTSADWADGDYQLTVSVTDNAGNMAISDELKVEIDTTVSKPGIALAVDQDTGNSATDNLTSKKQPTFTLSNIDRDADQVMVTVTGGKAETVAAKKDSLTGEWSFSPDTEWADGDYQLTVNVTDNAGNMAISDELQVEIDTTVSKPGIALATGQDTGHSATDNLTSKKQPTFTLSNIDRDANKVMVTVTGGKAETVAAKKDSQTGKWSFSPDTEWADGDYQLTVSVTDNAGNKATSDELQVVIDNTVSKPGIALATGQDTGNSATDNLTNQKQPTFTLSNIDSDVDESNIKVEMTDGSQTHLLAVTKNGGQWVATTSADWADGDYQLTVSVTDNAGNMATSDELQVVIDNTVSKPGIALATGQDTGHSATDNLTNQKRPAFTLSNIDSDADEVMVTVTGGKAGAVAAKKDSQTGKWSFSPDTEWADGDYQLTVSVTDNAGNKAISDELQVVIDNTVSKPGIALATGQDTGNSATDNLTNQKRPTFTLSNIDSDADQVMVTVTGGKAEVVAAKKDSQTGKWSFSPDTEWADGDYQLTVSVTDNAGNKAISDKLQVVIDNTVSKPGIALATGQDTGNSATDNLTNQKRPTFTLSNIDGDANEVMVTVTGGKAETVAAKKDSLTGEWSFSPDTEWADGDYQLRVSVTDNAGNMAISDELKVEIDTTVSKPGIALATGQDTGNSATDNLTSKKQPTFTLSNIDRDANQVMVTVTGGKAETVAAKKDSLTGEWSFSPDTEWADGYYQLTVSVTDNAGNKAISDKLQVEIDTTVNKPGIALATGQDTGNSVTDNLTNQKRPAFTLSNIDSDADEVVVTTVTGGKAEVVAAKKDSLTGKWSFSPDMEWADGDYQLTVSVTDNAGNMAISDELKVEIDTTVSKPGITLAVDQDSGHSATDNLTNVITPKFLINTDKDVDKLMVKVDSGQWIAATLTGTGIWSYTPDNPLLEGKRTLEVKAIDKAGNESHESIEVTVDISLSTPKIELASGQRVVNEGSDYHTNAKQPNFVINDISDDFYTVELKVNHHGNTELIKLTKTFDQWVFSPPKEWSDGDYKLEVVVVDKAGNERVSAPYSVIINTKTSVNLIKLVSDTGKDSSDNLTTENLPAFLIEVPLNVKQVRVSVDNGKSWIELPSGKGGLWNYTATNPLPEGENTLRVEATDFLGNTAEEVLKFEIDNTLSIPTIEFAAGEDTGSLATDGLTNKSQPKFDLSNIDPDVIEVKVHVKDMIGSNSYSVNAVKDSNSGQWGFTLPAKLADSSYQLTVTVADKAGNEQTSAELKIEVDTQLKQPDITLAAGHDSGSSNSDGLTNNTSPTFDLNNLDNDVVKAQVTVNIAGKTEIADAIQDTTTGKWSFTPSTAWGEGSYQLTVKVEDKAGNEKISKPLAVNIDTTFDINDINLLKVNGTQDSDNLTNQNKPQFLIDVPADTATVEASLDGTNWTKIALNATGQWVMVSPSTLPDKSYTLQVKATDKAGNAASKTFDFQIDTLLTIPEIKLGVDQDSGGSNHDAITNVSKPKFEISHIDSDVIRVTVMINGVGHDATDNNGKWSFQPSTTLTAGKYDVTVEVEDLAGNTKTSSVLKLDIDVSTEVTAINLLNDNGTQTDDYIISHKIPEFDIILPKDVQSVKVSLTGKDNDWITVNKNTQGQWLFSPKTELGDKEYTLNVKIVDTAGNEATKQQKFTVDTELNVPTLKLSPHSDSGEDNSDNLTKINKPEFLIGNTDNDVDKVLINIDGDDYKVNKSGAGWSFTPPTALNDGLHTVKVTVTDIAGNSKASDTLTVEIDTQTEIKDIKLVNDSGISDSDRLTNHTRPSIEVVVAKDVSRVQVSLDGKTWADATKKSDTQWDYAATAELKDGNHSLWVKATDKADNQANKKLDFIIDTHVDSLKIDMPDDTNKKPGGHITNVTTPRFNISAKEVLETVVVALNGTKTELTKDAGGAWSFTPNTALGEGTHILEVTATDDAGNSITKDITFEIDTTLLPPDIDLSNSDDSGDSKTDNITNVQQPTFIISQVPTDIDTVIVTINGTNYDIKAQPDGSYQFKPPVALSDGEYDAVVTFTDIAGNIVKSTLPFTIDTSVHLTAKMDPASDSGSSSSDNITHHTQPAFKVTADADSRVKVTIIDNANGKEVYSQSETIPKSGNLDFKANTLSDGNYTFKVTATDIAGNIETSTTKFTIDTTAIDPTIALTSHAPNNQFEALDLVPEFKGTAEAGSSVILSVDGKPVDTVTTDDNGVWRWMPSTYMPSGDHVVSVMTTDKAGNKSKEEVISVKIPYLNIEDPTIKLDEKSDTGALGDFVTSNQQPTIVGLAFPDTEVTIYLDNAKIGSVFADPLGNYSYTLPTNAEGKYSLKVGIKDPRDAKQLFSEEVKLVIDTHVDDISWELPDEYRAKTGYIKSAGPLVKGTSEPNSKVTILVNGVEHDMALTSASGDWKTVLPYLGKDGKYTIAIQVEDVAGNKKIVDSKKFILDTQHEAFSVSIKPEDDTGAKNNDLLTNKSTVVLEGKSEAGATVYFKNKESKHQQTVIADEQGYWSAIVTLAEGINTFDFDSRDKANNSFQKTISIELDSSITISAISLSDESNTGDRYDLVTSKKDAVLQAKTDPFASVEVIINGRSQGYVDANSSGTVTFPLPKDSNDGEYKVQFIATDAAGNIEKSPVATVILDSTISDFSVDNLPEQINQQGLPVSGKGEPGAKIEIYVNGVITGSTTVDKNGTWNTSVGLNTDDDYAIKIKISDVAGNFMESQEFNVKRDSFMVAPTIQLSPTTNSGAKDDSITNVNKPLLIGTAKAGATIILLMEDREFARVIADDTGNWSYECKDALKDGDYFIHVTAQDKAGNTANSHRLHMTIDTNTFVYLPVMMIDSQYTGMSMSAIVSKTANPIFSIDAELRQYVEVFIDGEFLEKVLISKSGQRYEIPTALSDGEHTISYSIIDKAGNKAESEKVSFIVDTSNIVPVTLDTINDTKVESITAQYGKIYIRDNSNLVKLRGQADADSRVEFKINGFNTKNVWTDENGNWSLSVDFAQFNEGQLIIEMKSTDRGGHTNSGASTLWLDTSISEFTCFLQGNKTPDKTLWSSDDEITVMHGRGEVGATISLMHDGKLVESTVVGTDGMWQISTNKLQDGESNIILTIKDLAEHQKSEHKTIFIDRSTPEVPEITSSVVLPDGGIAISGTAAGASWVYLVDKDGKHIDTIIVNSTTGEWRTYINYPPEGKVGISSKSQIGRYSETKHLDSLRQQGVITLDPASDTGVSGDNVTSRTKPTFNIDGIDNDVVSVELNIDGNKFNAHKVADGKWAATPDSELHHGKHIITATVTDKGNNTQTSEPYVFNIDIQQAQPENQGNPVDTTQAAGASMVMKRSAGNKLTELDSEAVNNQNKEDEYRITLLESSEDGSVTQLQNPKFEISVPKDVISVIAELDGREHELTVVDQKALFQATMPSEDGQYTLEVKFTDKDASFIIKDKQFTIDHSSDEIIRSMAESGKTAKETQSTGSTSSQHGNNISEIFTHSPINYSAPIDEVNDYY